MPEEIVFSIHRELGVCENVPSVLQPDHSQAIVKLAELLNSSSQDSSTASEENKKFKFKYLSNDRGVVTKSFDGSAVIPTEMDEMEMEYFKSVGNVSDKGSKSVPATPKRVSFSIDPDEAYDFTQSYTKSRASRQQLPAAKSTSFKGLYQQFLVNAHTKR